MENMREELGDLCNNSTAYERRYNVTPFNRNKPWNGQGPNVLQMHFVPTSPLPHALTYCKH